MKSLIEYICESSPRLRPGEKGIVVFDIDDTLITADSSDIGVIKYVGGDRSKKVRLTTDKYAKDPDALAHKEWFSYEEFDNPQKVVTSIIKGTPILDNMHIMDAYLAAGYKFAFLTARGCEDAVKYALKNILRVKADKDLETLGDKFSMKDSAAVNDRSKHYPGMNDPEKKANVLKEICSKYNKVVFVDDDSKNVAFARALHLPNLTVIKAAK